ncbi:MAG: efflux RND transporter periplasmic adaptor subunit [Gammaproteobacteria bacterium]|jgi:multidrug efflux system membrane fusion protein
MSIKISPIRYLTVAVFAMTAVLLSACGGSDKEATEAGRPAVAVQLMTLDAQKLPIYASLPGTVVPADQVQISSRLMGYVRDLKVHEGQAVEAGQVLLNIDPTDIKGGINQARAQVAQAKAALDEAESNYRRFKDLYEQKAIPKQEFEKVQTGYQVAKSQYEVAMSALKTAQSQLKYAEVRAPFSGIVVSKMVQDGTLAAPGHPLLTLENPKHLQVQVQVDGQVFQHMWLGQKLDVEVDGPDMQIQRIEGSVERMVTAADPVTHTHLVKIGLPENAQVASGGFARVHVQVGEESGVTVPASAIHVRAGIQGVFVVDKDNRSYFRMVRLGEQLPQGVVILSGLQPGEQVVLKSASPLDNGTPVKTETVPQEQAPAGEDQTPPAEPQDQSPEKKNDNNGGNA